MKILTREQEQAHYNATLKGGTLGGLTGLAIGGAGVAAASARYPFFRSLTLPLKAFLITSAGTFAGIVSADHSSRAFEMEQNPIDREFKERERQQREADIAGKTFTQRAMDWGKQERYKIVGASWIASMGVAFSLVNRNKYLTGQQKLVQARVYAQFLTLGVLIASAAFEISDSRNEEGRWETVKYVDPKDPEHKRMLEKRVEKKGTGSSSGGSGAGGRDNDLWKDMIAAEEERIKEREEEEKRLRKKYGKHHPATKSTEKSKKKAEDEKDKAHKGKEEHEDKKEDEDEKDESHEEDDDESGKKKEEEKENGEEDKSKSKKKDKGAKK